MFRLTAGIACHLLFGCCLAFAQGGPASLPKTTPTPVAKPAEPLSPKPTEASVAPIEELPLPLYYLKDKTGNLVAVPGFRLEDFENAYKLLRGLSTTDGRPRFDLSRLSVDGEAKGDYAELTLQITIVVREADWVRVPLALPHTVLREPAQYQGEGEWLIQFRPSEGYVCWLHGPAGSEHRLTLKARVPLEHLGREARLRLSSPPVTVGELKLRVPLANAVGKVSPGATLAPPIEADNGSTQFSVLGLSGDFELSWRPADVDVAPSAPVLEAVGTIMVRLDAHCVDTEATLVVRSYGAAFDRFRVQLPSGAELVPQKAQGYTISAVEASQDASKQSPVVEVCLEQKTTGPVEVRLTTRQPHEGSKADEGLEVSGFEVLSAARQWGNLAVAAPADRQVVWEASRAVRQVDQLPESLRRPEVVAGFEYYAMPCSLRARLVPRSTRIGVEPEYFLFVDSTQARLEAKLKYMVRGAKTSALEVVLPPGWILDDVGPEKLVALDALADPKTGLLSIPLLQPAAGSIEVRLRAHWPIARESHSLVIALPEPRAHCPSPANLAVVPADDVELIPNNKAMAGLTRQQAAPSMEMPPQQQDPLCYRSDGLRAVFAADRRVLKQSIAVEVVSQVKLDRQASLVEQKLSYRVAHKPADSFVVAVPRSVARTGPLEFLHDGRPLTQTPVDGALAGAGASALVRLVVPKPCLGAYEVTARFPLPKRELSENQATTVAVPLVMPHEGQITKNMVYVLADAGMRVTPPGSPWETVPPDASRPGERRGLVLAATGPAPLLELSAWKTDEDPLGTTIVDRAWVQTWISRNARQDRAMYAFTSGGRQLQVMLPQGTELNQLDVQLDGRKVAAQVDQKGCLIIPLPGDANQNHLLELRLHFAEQSHHPGNLSLELPRPAGKAWVRRLYWQLALPQNEHLVVAPKGFTSEFLWSWTGLFVTRKPWLEQAELEAWIGGPSRTPLPDGTNRYLFGSLGNVERGELYTAGRGLIVLVASGAALVLGLLLIYVPASRHPGTLFVVAVVLLGAGLVYPEPTLLIAQAASLGLALTLVAGLLERMTMRRRRKIPPEPTSAIRERGSAPSHPTTLTLEDQPPGQPVASAAASSTPDACP